MPNRLAGETSPYLLQHKDNPVDWYPWGDEALARAKAEDRALLVSIGYSACHWCHVMERESFEDPQTAALMNERFVCIKVDREEHPDVDAMCMEACQALNGQGGWPLNAFLTPDRQPFYAGTYYPPEPRQGLPSWRMVLQAIGDAWRDRQDELVGQATRLTEAIGASARLEPSTDPIAPEILTRAVGALAQTYDEQHGGWGGAPKFPAASTIEFLLSRGEREMTIGTLRAMAHGGIYDQIGGGFSRYAVDATWTVPHFEKMLYDNALLARAYLHGWQVSGDELLKRTCTDTLDWAVREMRSPDGGFYNALDADSEGVEGKFYVWTPEQLGDAAQYFELAPFEHGTYVLRRRGPVPDDIRSRLYDEREQRIHPGLDDKQLTSWNALMISALAETGATLQRSDYLEAATTCAEFLQSERRDGDGRLLRTDRLPGHLDDHAYLLEALLTLYEATFDPRWYHDAVALADQIIERFSDGERGGFFTTADDHDPLPVRRKDLDDAPIPAGNSSAAYGLQRLALLSGEGRYERFAIGVLRLVYPLAGRHPQAFGHLLAAADFYLARVKEVAIVGPGAEALVTAVRAEYRPHLVLAGAPTPARTRGPAPASGPGAEAALDPESAPGPNNAPGADSALGTGGVPLLDGREPIDGHAAAYVCEHFICQAPVTSPAELAALL
jgi:uncharacterized protein YyaL (SSP411 family)